MYEFGLTGGIGSGKSTVAAGLVFRGAVLIDADAIVRELQEPGGVVLSEMVEHFGMAILDSGGRLNRQAVADMAFSDEDQLAALNKIVHPRVMEEIARIRDQHAPTDALVVMDIPLLVRADGTKNTRPEYDELLGVVVVDCDPDMAIARLVEHRGFSEDDARARVANQATREARLAVADHVIDNSGSLDALEPLLDGCWSWMMAVTGGR
ncbi:MAG: dephospho-CoA kinase [Acidimicrobiales bacterium]